MTRRAALTAGILGLAGAAGIAGAPGRGEPAAAATAATEDDGSRLSASRLALRRLRALGQRTAPDVLLPVLAGETAALQAYGQRASGAGRMAARLLASRYAEYAGWMAQEQGDDRLAQWWTDRAVGLAAAGGDEGMAAYALVRRALIALYQGDGAMTVGLARQVRGASCRPRIRGLAAQREAQGHALARDGRACMLALDEARVLLAADDGDDGPVLGSVHVADPVAMTTGWALLDLGEPGRAAAVLSDELARVSGAAGRTRARYGARLARALAAAGRLDEACAAAELAVDEYGSVGSATIRADFAVLARTLRRWPSYRPARTVGARLAPILRPA